MDVIGLPEKSKKNLFEYLMPPGWPDASVQKIDQNVAQRVFLSKNITQFFL
jgi:hypothetical protein